MNDDTFSPEFLAFIDVNASEDVSRLRMKYHGQPCNFKVSQAIDNIECRRKSLRKLHHFITNGGIFPDRLSAEQATDEIVAAWHSKFISKSDRVADMTAGLGIDSMTIASKATSVHAFDINKDKTDALKRNAALFGIDNLTVECKDSVKALGEKFEYDVVFVDPARRGNENQRIFDLSSTVPDIVPLIPEYVSRNSRVYVKCSPMMDMSRLAQQIPDLKNIYAVSLRGECKEVFLECYAGIGTPKFHSVDLNDKGEETIITSLYQGEENVAEFYETADFDGKWLCEPSSAVMKLQPWRTLTEKYPSLTKLSPNTHLFISDEYIDDFPGKVRKISRQANKKDLKSLKGAQINVVSRNYPVDAKTLCKKYALKDGGSKFLYACRYSSQEHPILLVCYNE